MYKFMIQTCCSIKCFLALQKQMREYLVRLIYCEMLGHDASIGYVEAIKFAQQPNILDKRVGKWLLIHVVLCIIVIAAFYIHYINDNCQKWLVQFFFILDRGFSISVSFLWDQGCSQEFSKRGERLTLFQSKGTNTRLSCRFCHLLFTKVVCSYLVYGGPGGHRYSRTPLATLLGICFYNSLVRGAPRGVVFISDLLLPALPNSHNYVTSFTLKEDILLALTSTVLHRKKIF